MSKAQKIVLGIATFLGLSTAWFVIAYDPAAVNLRIEGSSQTYFSGEVEVGDCTIMDSSNIEHSLSGVAACALVSAGQEAGFSHEWVDYGFGLFMQSLGEDSTPPDFSSSWGFWVNDNSAAVGAADYAVSDGDDLLFSFAAFTDMPLRITAADTATVNEQVEILVEKRVGTVDDDWVWTGTWQLAEGATLHVGDSDYAVDETGSVAITFDEAGEIAMQADGVGFIRSNVAKILVVEEEVTPTMSPTPEVSIAPTVSPTPTPLASPTLLPSPTPTIAIVNPQVDLAGSARRALNYLRARQDENGSIGGEMNSAWATMAFGANSERAASIVNSSGLSLINSLKTSGLNSATDIERLILAVRASGVNPRDFYGQDLVALLQDELRDGQIGETSLINDDIFGVLAWVASGEPVSAVFIESGISTILNEQDEDGRWAQSVDLTAAAMQALDAYRDMGGQIEVGSSLDRAKKYLRARQDSRGGWGLNSATTSWTIQALVALGEDPNAWKNGNLTPWTALASYQNTNGGFGWQSSDNPSILMTAYAVPALLKSPWPIQKLSVEQIEIETEEIVLSNPTDSPILIKEEIIANEVSGDEIKELGVVAGVIDDSNNSLVDIETDTQEEEISEPEDDGSQVSGVLPLGQKDKNFMMTLFSLANMGVGVSVTRLISKLFI